MRSVPVPEPTEEPESTHSIVHAGPPPQAPSEIRTLLKAFGLRPQKGFGQHFLTSDVILRKIVAAGDVGPSDVVLEVGPGLGHLTHRLAQVAGRLIAVEIDRGLSRELRRAFQDSPHVEIVENDVLELDPVDVVGQTSYKVIANLPYYLTSAALRHFLENHHRPELLVVTVQREVGDRILARRGELNLLAISVNVFGQPRLITRIPPNAFYPQPTIESVVLRIDVFERPRIDATVAKFFQVVSAGFAMPRKQVHNSLAQRLWIPPGEAPLILQDAGIDPKRRPQTLTIAEWDRLTLDLGQRGLV
jgi:16S rRNA (adenine1518-N6/adenine1519-N6)-dimethyltransferase